MAKINELTDTQLEKALIQYRSVYNNEPTDKTKAILDQLQLERQKRQGAVKQDKEPSDLSKIARSAEVSMQQKIAQQNKTKSKAKPKEKNNGGISFKSRINNSNGSKIETKWSNLLLSLGWILGVPGLSLFVDAFITHWVPEFPYMTVCAIILIIAGVACAKIASHFSDDNT